MQELTPQSPDHIEQVAYIPKELQVMGSINKPHNGMKMFEVNPDTLIAVEVRYKQTSLRVKENVKVFEVKSKKPIHKRLFLETKNTHHQVIFDKNKWYCWAINEGNAVRKFQESQ